MTRLSQEITKLKLSIQAMEESRRTLANLLTDWAGQVPETEPEHREHANARDDNALASLWNI